MKHKKSLNFVVALLFGSTAFSGGVEEFNPAEELRQDSSVRRIDAVAARANGLVMRIRLRSPHDELYVMLSSEAITPYEAGQVRQVSLWLKMPAGRPMSTTGIQSLERISSKLGALCLDQRVIGLSGVMQTYAHKTLPNHQVLRRFSNGVTLETVPSLPWATSGTFLKVTIPRGTGAPIPRCVLPVIPPQ